MKRIALLVPLMALLWLAPPAFAETSGGLSITPLRNSSNNSGAGYFQESAEPGGTVRNALVVRNNTGEEVALRVYPVDGLTGVTTGSVFGNKEDKLRKDGSWVTVSPELVVSNGDRVEIPFTVNVPADATPGDHLAGIAIEPVSGRETKQSGPLAVNVLTRNVVGVLVRVAGPATKSLKLHSINLGQVSGSTTAAATVRIENTGQLLLKPQLAVTLSSQQSGYVKTVTRQLDTMLPGDPIDYQLAWPEGLSAGKYAMSAALTAEGAAPASMEGEVGLATSAEAAVPGAAPVAPESAVDAKPAWIKSAFVPVAAAGAAITALLLLARRSRSARRRSRGAHRLGETPRSAAGASLLN